MLSKQTQKLTCYSALIATTLTLGCGSSPSAIASEPALPGPFPFVFGVDRPSLEQAARTSGFALGTYTRPDGKSWNFIDLPSYLGLTINGEALGFSALFGFDKSEKLNRVEIQNFKRTTTNWCDNGSFANIVRLFQAKFKPAGNDNPIENSVLTADKCSLIGGDCGESPDEPFPQIQQTTKYRFLDQDGNLLEVGCNRVTWSDNTKSFEFFIEYSKSEGTIVE
ncbi:hypothetical protein [Mesorhizobium sp. M0227]|uniref:hypothetical protein n=1 Tax=Mesorhizobium sp. M0227 TaxID=2956922 RepID=UPI00333664D0